MRDEIYCEHKRKCKNIDCDGKIKYYDSVKEYCAGFKSVATNESWRPETRKRLGMKPGTCKESWVRCNITENLTLHRRQVNLLEKIADKIEIKK